MFPCIEYLGFGGIRFADVEHFVALFSIVHKFASLKVLEIHFEGDEGNLPKVIIPPQHCPSLYTLIISGLFLVQCFVLPNIYTLTTLDFPLPINSSNLSSLCACLGQTTSLKVLIITDADVTDDEARELASVLEKNRSLEVLGFMANKVTITDEANRIIGKVLNSRPSIKKIFLKDDGSPIDDDLELAMAESQATRSIEEDEELQQILALSLVEQ